MKKRGQLKLSFGMIFSIILIIVFLAFAFFSVKKFIDVSTSAQITQFKDNFQSDINSVWNSPQSNQELNYRLPKEVQKLCILDSEATSSGSNSDIYSDLKFYSGNSNNVFFYPLEAFPNFEGVEIKHLDIGTITANENPFCISNENGKINLVLRKNFDEIMVRVAR